MYIVKDIIYVLMEGNFKCKCIFEYWNNVLDDVIFIVMRINFNDFKLREYNFVLKKLYVYIKFVIFW